MMAGSSSYKMETDDFCNSTAADASTATSKTLIKCTQLPFLGEHPLHTTNRSTPCNNDGLEQIQIGYFYELNHQNLPRRSPIHLKSIRVVMVTERTDDNVAVKFPSSSSLRTYFRRVGTSITPPKLEEEFVMGSKTARDVLARQILPSEFSQRKKLESFWLVEPPKDESNDPSSSTCSPEIPVAGGGGGDDGSSIFSVALNSVGLMRWGVRRRVTFVGKHKEMKNSTDPAEPVVDGQSSLMEPGIKSEDEDEDVEAVVEGLMEQDTTDETRMKTRKRTREISLHSRKKAKIIKEHEKIKGKISTAGASVKKKIAGEQGKDKLSYDRWSKKRYKTAEGRMLDTLKETKAVFGQPILRRDLRLEARKHIGDTGLLDHLLKHMAGKVAPKGEMEYWLESADLVNVRKEAGVNDPYWTPPPGWKLGDNPSQHPVCAKELMLIKEEMADLKRRNMEELLVLKSSMSCITKEATVHVAGSLEGGQGNLIQQLPVAALMSSSPAKRRCLTPLADASNPIMAQVIVTKTTTTGGPTEPIMFGSFSSPVAATQPEPLQNPEIEVPVPQPGPQLIPIPRNFFARGYQWWHGRHYMFVLQFGIAERYMKGLSIYSLVSIPTIHGLWLCPNPYTYRQAQFKKELVDESRLIAAWPSYHAHNNDPFRAGKAKRHEKFWDKNEWDGHGRRGPMRQKLYFDFTLDTFDHFGPLVTAALKRNTITSERLANSFLDPEAFLLDMRSSGWYPTIHTIAKTSKEKGISSRFQALTEVRFYMQVADPRITLDPSTLGKESNYEQDIDINVITRKISSPENR